MHAGRHHWGSAGGGWHTQGAHLVRIGAQQLAPFAEVRGERCHGTTMAAPVGQSSPAQITGSSAGRSRVWRLVSLRLEPPPAPGIAAASHKVVPRAAARRRLATVGSALSTACQHGAGGCLSAFQSTGCALLSAEWRGAGGGLCWGWRCPARSRPRELPATNGRRTRHSDFCTSAIGVSRVAGLPASVGEELPTNKCSPPGRSVPGACHSVIQRFFLAWGRSEQRYLLLRTWVVWAHPAAAALTRCARPWGLAGPSLGAMQRSCMRRLAPQGLANAVRQPRRRAEGHRAA